jgi:hypothetical protein
VAPRFICPQTGQSGEKFMPVDFKQLQELRAQLAADRELCSNSAEAQRCLDGAERNIEDLENRWCERNPIAALDHVLSEIENNQIGRDSATSEEITGIAEDIREWETALKTVPTENRDLPLFKIAEKAVGILKQNCVALADKTDLELRMIAVFESTKSLRTELQEVDRLIQANAELNLGVTRTVFEYFRGTLAPVLESLLSKSLGHILTEVAPQPDADLEKVFGVIGDGWRNLVRKPQHGDRN